MSTVERKVRSSSRGALLEAALAEFAEHGYEQATVAGIAERAGVTTGALYGHFQGKLDLLVAAIGVPGAGDFWREVVAVAQLPWDQVTRALAEGLAARPDQRTLLLLDVIVLARRDPEVAAAFRATLDDRLGAVERATEEGQRAGLIEPALSPADHARLLAVLAFGMVVLGALGQPAPSLDGFVQLVDLLLQSHPPEDPDDDPSLTRVRNRSAAVERARARQHVAIADAADEGLSLRKIGTAAGLSHERVRAIVAEHRRRR